MLTVLFDNVILYQTIENILQIMIRRTVYLIKNIQSLSRRLCMKKLKLSNKELDVMIVLWNSEQALASSDISRIDSSLNINTVRVTMKNLLKKSYIEVADIAQRGTVLTRIYRPAVSYEEYLCSQIQHMNYNSLSLISTLIKQEKDIDNLNELEKIINEHIHNINNPTKDIPI